MKNLNSLEAIFVQYKEINCLVNAVAEIAGFLWQRGWSEKNAGNISVRMPAQLRDEIISQGDEQLLDSPVTHLRDKCFFITGTGTRMRDVAREPLDNGLFIRINERGDGYFPATVADAAVKPSSELLSHLSIHDLIAQRRTAETVVIHTHATELIALTHWDKIQNSDDLNTIIWGMHPEAMVFIPKGVGLVPYFLPGSQKIAEATVKSFENHDIVLWKKHGVFAIGKTLHDTFDKIDIVCKSAKIWMQGRAAGFTPEGLTNSQLDELKQLITKYSE
jgi:rhamnulose-1-phosphate aldolase